MTPFDSPFDSPYQHAVADASRPRTATPDEPLLRHQPAGLNALQTDVSPMPAWPLRWLEEALDRLTEAEQTIAHQREQIAYLETLTFTDELTGLFNRRGFLSHLRRALSAVGRSPEAAGAVIMIDLDGFKAVNDTHGHVAGDAYLRQVGQFLVAQVRPQDVVARLGGDEFAILLTHVDAPTSALRAAEIADRIHGQVVSWRDTDLPVRFSLGMEPFRAGDTGDDVIRRADRKMYAQKKRRRLPRADVVVASGPRIATRSDSAAL